MTRHLLLTLFLPIVAILSSSARAQDEAVRVLGEAISGVRVVELDNGELSTRFGEVVRLSNGAVLTMIDGRTTFTPAPDRDAPGRPIAFVEALVSAPELVGQRIRLSRVPITKVTFKGASGTAVVGRPASFALDLASMDKDDIRYLLIHCSGQARRRMCELNVTGRIERVEGWFGLTDAKLSRP